MIFHKKNKYDLIMSIGEACFCSQSLRYRNLQRYSYPLDWGFGGNFEKRLSIVKNKFDEHFKKEFLECLDFYDDVFPNPVSTFRFTEYEEYMKHFKDTKVFTTGKSLVCIKGAVPIKKLIK